ncbi:hypothetical protein D9Q98_005808 [Chlorella vulgaris]|uniref:Uncharacterized protein n=1 Tax=Chlorella vulgaris TaxID=3077 RepID=A0A9D4TWE6_CHLVU|nr:hypothetical protein D9Q98_005808 [Chlorella vulgaris]
MATLTCCLPGVPRSAPRAKVDGLRTRHAPLCVTVRHCRLPPVSALLGRDNDGGPVKPYLSFFQETPSWEEIEKLSGGSECRSRELKNLALKRLSSGLAGLIHLVTYAIIAGVVLLLQTPPFHAFRAKVLAGFRPGELPMLLGIVIGQAPLMTMRYIDAHLDLNSAIKQALQDRN